ncbi:unnamed protein product [Brassica oleracea var. botrytis]
MKRLKVDLDRRIHDQKFGKEIMNITDADWTKDGDFFQKPFSLGGGASCNARDNQGFASGGVSKALKLRSWRRLFMGWMKLWPLIWEGLHSSFKLFNYKIQTFHSIDLIETLCKVISFSTHIKNI